MRENRNFLALLLILLCFVHAKKNQAQSSNGKLKFVIYDFDGLDIGATNLPDGDFKIGDLSYSVAANPLPANDMLGDRVLKAELNWTTGTGEFGRGMDKYIQFDPQNDRINFYFYSGPGNSPNICARVILIEDDNGDDIYQSANDDSWVDTVYLNSTASWQLISLPLSGFKDRNTGGNGIFDIGFGPNEGMLFIVRIAFDQMSPAINSETYYLDMISFSEGNIPHGNTILDLPGSNGTQCELGAFCGVNADSIPAEIENKFSNGKKITYAHWFLPYAYTGTVPTNFPGQEVQNLLSNGYRPIITWEMMYTQYSRLDPVQPRLNKINNGDFDSYIDSFADKIKTYNDTIIIRIFHEFDGFWYAWCISQNNNDTVAFVNAFRRVVDRFNLRGATKVLWMWCPNSDAEPYTAWNWKVNAYPGDSYAGIVATDIYNHPNAGVPDWRSFRYYLSESYYYLTKYFPSKPFFICELACRERYSGEDITSQTKAEWLCAMTTELKTFFSETDAIIFFDNPTNHDWRVNSSAAALSAMSNCVWNDSYFGQTTDVIELTRLTDLNIYPNPFENEIYVKYPNHEFCEVKVTDCVGKVVFSNQRIKTEEKISFSELPGNGIYFMEIRSKSFSKTIKVIRQ